MILQAELKDKKITGFTLIELLIVISVLIILTTVSIPIYGNLQVSSQINENSSQIIQTLRIAKERSMAGLNNQQHGVQLQTDKYILYQGSSYSLRDDDYDREIIFDDVLSLFLNLNGSGELNDINFSMGLGMPNKTGVIDLIHSVNGTRIIVINEMGIIKEE